MLSIGLNTVREQIFFEFILQFPVKVKMALIELSALDDIKHFHHLLSKSFTYNNHPKVQVHLESYLQPVGCVLLT